MPNAQKLGIGHWILFRLIRTIRIIRNFNPAVEKALVLAYN
jgi:hypothetical protein